MTKSFLQISLFATLKSKPAEKLRKTLSLVHLRKELNSSAEKLSGREKQRLALGRILLLEPDVMLLDEPSAGLDEETEQLIVNGLVAFPSQADSQDRADIRQNHLQPTAVTLVRPSLSITTVSQDLMAMLPLEATDYIDVE